MISSLPYKANVVLVQALQEDQRVDAESAVGWLGN
jgi:hypothetical protein